MISPSNNNTQINFKRKIKLIYDEIFEVFHEISFLSFEIFSGDSHKISEINCIYLFIFENFLFIIWFCIILASMPSKADCTLDFGILFLKIQTFIFQKPKNHKIRCSSTERCLLFENWPVTKQLVVSHNS